MVWPVLLEVLFAGRAVTPKPPGAVLLSDQFIGQVFQGTELGIPSHIVGQTKWGRNRPSRRILGATPLGGPSPTVFQIDHHQFGEQSAAECGRLGDRGACKVVRNVRMLAGLPGGLKSVTGPLKGAPSGRIILQRIGKCSSSTHDCSVSERGWMSASRLSRRRRIADRGTRAGRRPAGHGQRGWGRTIAGPAGRLDRAGLHRAGGLRRDGPGTAGFDGSPPGRRGTRSLVPRRRCGGSRSDHD